MPQFLFIDLPNFRIRDAHGQGVSLSYKQLGHIIALYQYVRSGLRSTEYADLCASLVFAAGETGIWTSYTTSSDATTVVPATASSSTRGSDSSRSISSSANPAAAAVATTTIHAEENMLLAYHHSFDSPGAYPIVDALLLHAPAAMGYFTPSSAAGKTCKPSPSTPAFRAKFTPRSDRSYAPVFYLSSSTTSSSSYDPSQNYEIWLQLGGMWAADFAAEGRMGNSLEVAARGQIYYLMPDCASPWFALNDQETMSNAEVAEAIVRQGVAATY
ncbi:hypothetical protein PG994_009881 [Apiospora phragmitis]|uniref:Uncharacterized protein n=1 Tax=Apiospora phragmitis TaxID=2905665 RepID=A0ABR1TNC9_9PEZI